MYSLDDLAQFLEQLLGAARYPGEPSGVFIPSSRAVLRLGLALEPFVGLGDWLRCERVDALFLHRPWRLALGALPPGVGVLTSHLAFDERLTLGMNPWLAQALGLRGLEPLGEKAGRVIGMIGQGRPRSFAVFRVEVAEVFGGVGRVLPGRAARVRRVAVVGAMNAALISEAAARGADVYLTGQLRPSARGALKASGLGVIEVGHARSEHWGLALLAGLLQDALPGLEVVLAP